MSGVHDKAFQGVGQSLSNGGKLYVDIDPHVRSPETHVGVGLGYEHPINSSTSVYTAAHTTIGPGPSHENLSGVSAGFKFNF